MKLQVALAGLFAIAGLGWLAKRSRHAAQVEPTLSPAEAAELERHFAQDGPERLLPALGLETLRQNASRSRRAATQLRRLLQAELRRATEMRQHVGNDQALLQELERTAAAARSELAAVERTRRSLPFWS